MLASMSMAATALHDTASGNVVARAVSSLDTDIAMALLHDDGEDDALINTDFGAFLDGVPDAADVFACVARREHGLLVAVEHVLELEPLVDGGEALPAAGVVVGSHCRWKVVVGVG